MFSVKHLIEKQAKTEIGEKINEYSTWEDFY